MVEVLCRAECLSAECDREVKFWATLSIHTKTTSEWDDKKGAYEVATPELVQIPSRVRCSACEAQIAKRRNRP